MSPREATRYLFWYGEKAIAGDEPTQHELDMFIEAREVSMQIAGRFMMLGPEDWKYTPGKPYE